MDFWKLKIIIIRKKKDINYCYLIINIIIIRDWIWLTCLVEMSRHAGSKQVPVNEWDVTPCGGVPSYIPCGFVILCGTRF